MNNKFAALLIFATLALKEASTSNSAIRNSNTSWIEKQLKPNDETLHNRGAEGKKLQRHHSILEDHLIAMSTQIAILSSEVARLNQRLNGTNCCTCP